MDPITMLLPALLPVVSDGVRAVMGRIGLGAGANPQSVAERIQLMQAETERLQALAAMDTPSANISPWVANLRASFRYVVVLLIVGVTLTAVLLPSISQNSLAVLLDLSGACMSFIIGERMYLQLKKP